MKRAYWASWGFEREYCLVAQAALTPACVPLVRSLVYSPTQLVAGWLHDKGRQTLGMVAAGTGLKLKQAQQALFVLMQHLLVRARTEMDPRHQRALVWYTLDVDALLARLHYAQFLAETLRYFGREVRRSSPS